MTQSTTALEKSPQLLEVHLPFVFWIVVAKWDGQKVCLINMQVFLGRLSISRASSEHSVWRKKMMFPF